MNSWQKICLGAAFLGSAGVIAQESKAPRIVEGSPEVQADAPWQVFLVIGDPNATENKFCGGFVLSPGYVLTAAHCVDGYAASQVVVFGGINNLTETTEDNSVAVSDVFVHPGYDNRNFIADVAVLKLSSALPAASLPIQLLSPSAQIDMDNEFASGKENNLYISGWGASKTDGDLTNRLQKTLLSGVPDNQCGWNFIDGVYSESLGEVTVCANQPFTTGVCDGDSGGALIWQDPSHVSDPDRGYRAVGIVSFSSGTLGCGSPKAEDGFTQVSTYLDWIDGVMANGYEIPAVSYSGADIFYVVPETATGGSAGSGGGGGGTVGGFSLLLLPLLAWLRRKRCHTS